MMPNPNNPPPSKYINFYSTFEEEKFNSGIIEVAAGTLQHQPDLPDDLDKVFFVLNGGVCVEIDQPKHKINLEAKANNSEVKLKSKNTKASKAVIEEFMRDQFWIPRNTDYTFTNHSRKTTCRMIFFGVK